MSNVHTEKFNGYKWKMEISYNEETSIPSWN